MSAFRHISTDGLPAVTPPAMGSAPMLQWAPIARMVVDGAYQREVSRRGRINILEIARNFRWSRFSPVIVSPVAGGLLAIIDGQHRVTAAALLGLAEVPTQVIIADQAEQADAFRAINAATTAVSPMAVHHAAVIAGDPTALEVQRICDIAQVRILRSNPSTAKLKPGDTTAPLACYRILASHGAKVLQRALQAITQTPNNLPGALRGLAIIAVSEVVAGAPELLNDPDRLLKIWSLIEIEQEIEAVRMTRQTGGSKVSTALINHLTGVFLATRAESGL